VTRDGNANWSVFVCHSSVYNKLYAKPKCGDGIEWNLKQDIDFSEGCVGGRIKTSQRWSN